MNKKLDFKMSFKEFNERCISNGQATAEFDLRPVDIATKDNMYLVYKVLEIEEKLKDE